MNKLSYKTLLIIFFFLLICIVVLIKITSPIKKVSAAWWNENWSYRQAINISSHDTSESNVYITTTINIDPATKAQSDDGDFRFVDQTGNLLPYYVYSGVGTTNIVFHIQFSSFPSGAQTIYAYYGNSSATNGFSATDFTTQASNYTIGSLNTEEISTNYNSSESNFSVNLGIQSSSPLSGESSAVIFGTTTQTIGGTTTNLDYCIPGDTSACDPPIAEWKMEENTGTTAYDSSGNNNNGIFGTGSSAPTWTVGQNNSGSGLKFDGSDDYITSTAIPITQEMTWETWYKANTAKNEFLLDQRASEVGVQPIYVYSDGRIQISDSTTGSYTTASNTFKFDNKWHHITVIGTSSSRNIYIDGINVGSTNTGITTKTARAIYFGSRHTLSSFFNGSIDQVRIYNYARTPAQIAYDYNKGAPIGWWKFDECQGSTAFDSSGLGNTGTISIGLNGSQNTLGTCQVGTSAAWTNGASGKLNSSLNLDGTDDFLKINYAPQYNIRKAISLSIWIKRTTDFSQSQDLNLLSRYLSWYFYDSYYTGNIRGDIYIDGVRKGILTTPVPYDGNWYQIIYTYDSDTKTAKMYKNGKLVKTSILTGLSNYLIDSSTSNFGRIGSSLGRGIIIDDARIYNYALTAEQIKTLYNNGAINFQ